MEALDEFLRAGDFSLDAVTARVGDETLTADLRYVIATAEKIAHGRYGIAYAPAWCAARDTIPAWCLK